MNAIKNIISRTNAFLFICAVKVVLLSSCEEEDPFVDRTVSPVLLVFEETKGYLSGGGLIAVPSVEKIITPANAADPVTLSVLIYELDKSKILDHTIGIDSIPVQNLDLTFSKRDGSLPIIATSDASGRLSVSTTWAELGIADAETIANAPEKKSITIGLSWTGSYKGQSFVRFSQVVFSKP